MVEDVARGARDRLNYRKSHIRENIRVIFIYCHAILLVTICNKADSPLQHIRETIRAKEQILFYVRASSFHGATPARIGTGAFG